MRERERACVAKRVSRGDLVVIVTVRFSKLGIFGFSQSVSYFTVPPRAHPSTGSQSGSATPGLWIDFSHSRFPHMRIRPRSRLVRFAAGTSSCFCALERAMNASSAASCANSINCSSSGNAASSATESTGAKVG